MLYAFLGWDRTADLGVRKATCHTIIQRRWTSLVTEPFDFCINRRQVPAKFGNSLIGATTYL